MKILYITVKFPYGPEEAFLYEEIAESCNLGNEVYILPLRPGKKSHYTFPDSGNSPKLLVKPFFSPGYLPGMIAGIFRQLRVVTVCLAKILFASGGPSSVIKNLSLLPKALYLQKYLTPLQIDHIHAYWMSTPASLAYMLSLLLKVPWSLTAHRWDIILNNLLKVKVASASFVRVISNSSKNLILERIPGINPNRISVLHLGIRVPAEASPRNFVGGEDKIFIIGVPAFLTTVKGHVYLIDAVKKLTQEGFAVRLELYGSGYLEPSLRAKVRDLGLQEIIRFNGLVSHSHMMEIYSDHQVHCVVLPSIKVREGVHEGIPVSLMEAMSYCIPVISTNTGGIPELLDFEAGIIVNEKSADALKQAIIALATNHRLYKDIAMNGYRKVSDSFNVRQTVKALNSLFQPGQSER